MDRGQFRVLGLVLLSELQREGRWLLEMKKRCHEPGEESPFSECNRVSCAFFSSRDKAKSPTATTSLHPLRVHFSGLYSHTKPPMSLNIGFPSPWFSTPTASCTTLTSVVFSTQYPHILGLTSQISQPGRKMSPHKLRVRSEKLSAPLPVESACLSPTSTGSAATQQRKTVLLPSKSTSVAWEEKQWHTEAMPSLRRFTPKAT